MSQDNPKVSVCLMTYNGAATVGRALTTLLGQTYRNYEVVVSDDHSSDETLAICERIAEGHKHVRFIRPEHNLGAYHNMRFALSHARGQYFLWACQDDWWEPEFLERLVDTLEQRPGAICAQGCVRWVSEDGTKWQDLRLCGRDLPERQSPLALAVSILTAVSREGNLQGKNMNILKNNIFMHGLWRRDAFTNAIDAHGKAFAKEREIVCQLALAGDFCYVDEWLFHKTYHNEKLRERYAKTDPVVVAKANSGRWSQLRYTLRGIVRSPDIGWFTKLMALPVLTAAYSWHHLRPKDMPARALKRIVPASLYGALRRLYRKCKPAKSTL